MNDILAEGIELARHGEMEKARTYLSKAVRLDPSSEQAWLWLGHCLTDREQRCYCYQRVLRLNPQHAEAQRSLLELHGHPPAASTQIESASQPKPPPLQESPDVLGKSPPKLMMENASPPPNRRTALSAMIGLLGGLLLCGLPLVFLILGGWLDPYLSGLTSQIPPSPATTLTPLPSPTITRTATLPPPTPTVNQAADAALRAAQVETYIRDAESLITLQKKHADAIPLLNLAIETAPELDKPYYLRATCYYELMSHQRSQVEYSDYLDRALADIDQAIAIRPDDGNYYALRQRLLVDLAGNLEYRVDKVAVTRLALENARMELALGTTLNDYPERSYLNNLIFTEQCEEAVQEAQRLIDMTDPKDASIGGLYHIQSQAYICLGQVDKAIKMVDKSMFNNVNMEYKKWLKANYLYYAGRSNQALQILNELIEARPSYSGYRYYLRALIYYEKGERDKAEEDLMIGAGNTWAHSGVYSYVLGKMALDDGDREEGIALLQYAEATLEVNDNPLRYRIQAELKELGAEPLEITTSAMLDATAIPTIQPRPTARVLQPTPTRASGALTAIPYAQHTYPPGIEKAIIVDTKQGTGKLTLLANDYPLFRFQPPQTIKVKTAKNIVIHLLTAVPIGAPSVQIYLYNAYDGGWNMIEPTWGDNPVEFPERYVYPEGDIFIAVRNWGNQTVSIDNLGITIVVEMESGEIITIGPE